MRIVTIVTIVALLAALTVALLVAGGCGERGGGGGTGADFVSTPGPVFLLGFDGIDPGLVTAFEEEGLLPNFARLRREGASAEIRSTLPMISPPAWTSVITGVPPADHGIWSFWIPDANDPRGRYVDATYRLAPAIWEDLTARGRTVGIVNVPITCPPDSVNGFQIAGFPYPARAPLTWPPELEAEIVARGYERDAFLGPPGPGQAEAWLDRMWMVGNARREIGLDLLFTERPDLSFVVFTLPDRIQHHLWKFRDPRNPHYRADAPERLGTAVRDVYVWCDDILGEVLGRLRPDETLIVLSDHGFGPARLGISKARLLAGLPARLSTLEPYGMNLFGGDIYLRESTREQREELVAILKDARAGDVRLVREAHDLRSVPNRGFGMELGPAVYLEEAEGLLFVPGSEDGLLLAPLSWGAFSGYHRRDGYFAMRGPAVVPGAVRTLDLQDIPALTLYLLGEPIPRRYVPNPPRQLFPVSYFVERPMEFVGDPAEGLRHPGEGPVRDAVADDVLEEQLRALGYVQ